MKVKRQIIRIDEDLCDGCEMCIPACPEGALQIVDGVAKVVKEGYCDGLGACLGECPQGALSIEEREVEEYDEQSVIQHLKENAPDRLEEHMKHLREHGMAAAEVKSELAQASLAEVRASSPAGGGCPSARMMRWGAGGATASGNSGPAGAASVPAGAASVPAQEGSGETPAGLASELRQWPIQLHLVNPIAPYFREADLVLVADCVPFAYANFHQDFLKGRAIAIACPKLDDTRPYIQKLTQMVDFAILKSMKVVVMEVPCCSGLVAMAREAVAGARRSIPIEYLIVGIQGGVKGQAL